MEQHDATGARLRFPSWAELETVDRLLSDFDTRLKTVYEGTSK
jgi:hypothetical protein